MNPAAQTKYDRTPAELIVDQPQSHRAVITLILSNNVNFFSTSSMLVFPDGTVQRNRSGTLDGFRVSPDLVSTIVQELTRENFFKIEESAITRGINEANALKRGMGGMIPGRGVDGTFSTLTVVEGRRANTVGFYGVENRVRDYPMVESLKMFQRCLDIVESKLWTRLPSFWEELPFR
jgi:hypothetical protein